MDIIGTLIQLKGKARYAEIERNTDAPYGTISRGLKTGYFPPKHRANLEKELQKYLSLVKNVC